MADWITINPTSGCNDGSVSFTASKNTTGAERSAKYRIYNDDYGIEKIVTVSQPAYVEPTGNTKIYYTSTDGNVVTPYTLSATDAEGNTLTYTNTYSDGQGIIAFNGVVKDINMKFKSCTTLKTFDGISNKVKLASDASWMFDSCTALTSLDVSNFDTSSVTNMYTMFHYCIALTTIKGLEGWDTSSVTNMYDMFGYCKALTSLDVSNWNTSSVTKMSGMFGDCSSLTSLNVSNWNTSSVTAMNGTFSYCSKLTTLDLSNFDTSKVTIIYGMFGYSSSLSTLKIGSNCTIGSSTKTTNMFTNVPSSGTLQYPTGMDSTQVAKWTPTGWTAVAY